MIDLVKHLINARNILIVCHVRPDGDCLGAGFSLYSVAKKLNKSADFLCDSPFPEHYSFIKNHEIFGKRELSEYDLAISVDCADEFRMGEYSDIYFSCKQTVNIDHHATNTMFAAVNEVCAAASSTCEIVYLLLKDSGLIDAGIAQDLYMGISTDTGHFRHSNTKPNTLLAAAHLLEFDFDAVKLVDNLYRNNTVEKMRLIGLALNKMHYYCDEKVAVIALSQRDLKECGCVMADTEGIIDYPMSVGSVVVAVCMTQQSSLSFKVSFRSKGPNVAKIAGKFGGGGHVLAAGCVVNGDFNSCVAKVVKAVSEDML